MQIFFLAMLGIWLLPTLMSAQRVNARISDAQGPQRPWFTPEIALSKLLDREEQPARGNHLTVCNTGYDPNLNRELPMGSNYRLVVDLSNAPTGLWTVDAQGQSGQPGSPHYCDQRTEWMAGGYHYLLLDCSSQLARKRATLTLQPFLA